MIRPALPRANRFRPPRPATRAAAGGHAHTSDEHTDNGLLLPKRFDLTKMAGSNGLRFAASYHHSPSTVLDAVEAYRKAFRPSCELARPYVSVSADVVAAEDDVKAARLAAGYGLWVRSIRTGAGAIAFPTPETAESHLWTDQDRDLVKDRIDSQLVGSPQTVADRLEQLQQATGANELAITTITHQHADRVRSYELLSEEWHRRQSRSRSGHLPPGAHPEVNVIP